MSKTATVDIVVNVQGDGTNESWRLSTYAPISLTDSPGTRVSIALSAGFNSIPLMLSADGGKPNYFLALPPSTSTNVKTLKGVTGDTGKSFTAQPFLIPIQSTDTAIGITSTTNETIMGYFL